MARAEQQDGGKGNPAPHGMYHHRAGEIVKFFAKAGLEPGLDAEGLVPGDALEEGVNKADQDKGGDQLRMEASAFGNAAGDDGGDGGHKSEQEEELGQLKAVLF